MNRRSVTRATTLAWSVSALVLAGCSVSSDPAVTADPTPSAAQSSSPATAMPADPQATAAQASPEPQSSRTKAAERKTPGSSSSAQPRRGGLPKNAAYTPPAGRHYARSQSKILARLPGSAEPVCVRVGNRRDVRSGGIAAGPFDTARTSYGTRIQPGLSRRTVRLYWIPEHSQVMPGVTIEMQRLRPSGDAPQTVRQEDFADAEQWRFYDTNLEIPTSGTWRLRATAGQDTGCFEVTFAE